MRECGADLSYPVLDEACNALGFLNGFVGNSDINGIDFMAEANLQEVIWGN